MRIKKFHRFLEITKKKCNSRVFSANHRLNVDNPDRREQQSIKCQMWLVHENCCSMLKLSLNVHRMESDNKNDDSNVLVITLSLSLLNNYHEAWRTSKKSKSTDCSSNSKKNNFSTWIEIKFVPSQFYFDLRRLNIMRHFLCATFLILFVTQTLTRNLKSSEPVFLPLQLEFPTMEIFFDCNDNKFISKDLICDGKRDCQNGADEESCELTTTAPN